MWKCDVQKQLSRETFFLLLQEQIITRYPLVKNSDSNNMHFNVRIFHFILFLNRNVDATAFVEVKKVKRNNKNN